ncbi:MAG: zinc ribbon domain-containing protein [Dehalococcoidia bacterium]
MPIYEYYCAKCNTEYESIRPAAKADDPAPCKTCGEPGQRQLSNFAFKSNTFTSPRFKPSTQRPMRSYDREESTESSQES